jgi:hypothetical protein
LIFIHLRFKYSPHNLVLKHQLSVLFS